MRTPEQATLKDLQRDGTARLRAGGSESAALDARLLLCHAAGVAHEALVAHGADIISDRAAKDFERYLARREMGEPVARILGEKEFWGLPFKIGPDTLVPRPDSECVVSAALNVISDSHAALRVLDLGTGSGCLLLALLCELPSATGLGVDISEGAVGIARENAEALDLSDRASFVQSNWTKGLDTAFDLIISNPPYIPMAEIASLDRDVRDHDPARALDGGADGMECYRALVEQIPNRMTPGGYAVFETSPDLYAELFELIEAAPYLTTPVGIKDLAGRWRGLSFGKDDLLA